MRLRLLSIGFMLIVFRLFLNAQNPTSHDELVQYFENNLSEVHPIEGMFQITQRTIPGPVARSNGVVDVVTDNRTFWIYYDKSKNDFRVFKEESSGSLRELGFKIALNGSGTYTISINGKTANILSPESFGIYDDSRPQNAILETNFTKVFPTKEMYAEATKKETWSGSGFALNDGYVITNHHVIDGANIITLQGINGDFEISYKAIVVASDQANDIALLKIKDERFKGFVNIPYQLRTTIADVGEAVFALGYPLADVMGSEIKFTDGRISSRTGIQGAANVYQITVPIQPGNSGGPLFDQQGRIVGITTSSLNKDMFDAENVNYAVKTGYILNLIENTTGRDILPMGTSMRNQTIPQKVKLARDFVFFIKCSN